MPRKIRTRYLIALLSFASFISCSKNNTDDPATGPCDRIIEVLDYHPYEVPQYQTTVVFTYDEKGRIKVAKGSGQNKAEYTYYNDRIELKATDIYGVDISRIYYLDNSGRIKRTDVADEAYTYNSEGYLISYKQYHGYNGQITGFVPYYLKWENGNLAEVYTTDQTVSQKKVAFQYFDSENKNVAGYNSPFYIASILGDRNSFFLLQAGFYGKQSKNLMKNVNFNDGGFSDATTYHYDSKGRIIGLSQYYKFNYQCP